MESTQGEMEGKDMRKIKHSAHDHSLVLRESLQGHGGYGGGRHRVYCDGCRKPISPSSSVGGGRGNFYACPNYDCWFLLHKRCAELPSKIEHPFHPMHALTLSYLPWVVNICEVCESFIDGFRYYCSDCDFFVHACCASIAIHIQDRVDEKHKIHQHPLIPIEMEAQFLCALCGRKHSGKSYLCTTCGFWANQICASAPTRVDLHSHPHPLALVRSVDYILEKCKICDKRAKRACWFYSCSEECKYVVHVSCMLLEEAENSNKDIQTKFHSKSTSHEIEMPTDSKEDTTLVTWPLLDEPAEIITQLIKNLQGKHKRDTKIILCKKDHPLIFVDQKIDEPNDDQQCDGCAQTISSQFYHCAQCNFSLHKWCTELPSELKHVFHPEHPLRLLTQQQDMYLRLIYCNGCRMPTNGFVFCCFTCDFVLDLKCASLPRFIRHQAHDHDLVLRTVMPTHSCTACGLNFYRIRDCFRCEACNFGLCIKCALLPFSVRHWYDEHPFALTYSSIKGQPDEYYCEICEANIDTKYWFYHCIECDQSLHVECIYSYKRNLNVKFGGHIKVDSHSHLLTFVRYPKAGKVPCSRPHSCHFGVIEDMAYECEQCDFWLHFTCSSHKLRIS